MLSKTRRNRIVAGEGAKPTPDFEQHKETRQSVIGASLNFKGEIHSTGSLRIEGQVEGIVTARSLVVSEHARIEGQITADILQIDGTVIGDLDAGTVVLGRTARVKGDILHRSLAVDAGAAYEGKVRHKPEKPTAEAKPSAEVKTSGQTKVPEAPDKTLPRSATA